MGRKLNSNTELMLAAFYATAVPDDSDRRDRLAMALKAVNSGGLTSCLCRAAQQFIDAPNNDSAERLRSAIAQYTAALAAAAQPQPPLPGLTSTPYRERMA